MRAVLDRMLDEYHGRIIAERLTLRRRRDLELRGRNPDRHNTQPFEPRDVMHTARRAGASISQAFDDEVAFGLDLLFELKRRQMGEVLLAVALHRVATGRQKLVEPIEKFIAAHLGDVEQPDRLARDGWRTGETRGNRRRRLGRGVEENVVRHRYLISLVTGSMLPLPPIDGMMAEYLPALPPARMMLKVPFLNLGIKLSGSAFSSSVSPDRALRPGTSSRTGIFKRPRSSSLTRAFDQPAS